MTRHPLHTYMLEAVTAWANRVAPDDPQHAADLIESITRPGGPIRVLPAIDQPRHGRINTRTGQLIIAVQLAQGLVPLASVRLRDVQLPAGVDTQAEVRAWLYQLGVNIPDSPAALDPTDGTAGQ